MSKLGRERLAYIAQQGLELQRVEQRGKHVAFICTEGMILCGRTPSDRRERDNFRAQVRRLGRL